MGAGPNQEVHGPVGEEAFQPFKDQEPSVEIFPVGSWFRITWHIVLNMFTQGYYKELLFQLCPVQEFRKLLK